MKAGYGLYLFDFDWFDLEKVDVKLFKLLIVVLILLDEDKIYGIKDICFDDYLWIVLIIFNYVKETGDFVFIDEVIFYVDGGNVIVYEYMMVVLDFFVEYVG